MIGFVAKCVEAVKARTATTLLVTTLLSLMSGIAVAAVADQIRDRIAPVGEVCVMGDACAAGVAMAGGDGGPKEPQQVYQTFCFACHGTGANNAPVLGDASAWQPRIDERGVDGLYAGAIEGFNNGAMPAKGLCMDCSDDDIRATVDYILESL